MRLLVLLATVALSSAAPTMVYTSGPFVAHADSLTPPVTRIQEPGIKLFNPVQVAHPVQVVAPVQVAAPIQMAAPVQVATTYQAPVPVAAPVQVATTYQAPVPVAAPVQVATTYQAPVPVAAPVVVATPPEPLAAPAPPMPSLNVPFEGGQFHSQDEAKQYSFGHWGGPSTRLEAKDYLGRVSGSFAYVNPEGDVQVRKYAAAPAMGFKVAASDLPKDTPAVAQVKALHEEAQKEARKMSAQ